MATTHNYLAGRHFLQVPGPSNVPDRVLQAMARPVIDHRGPEFPALTLDILGKLQAVIRTSAPVFIYPASGTGGWESALLNALSPGDRVVAFETGYFATLWKNVADKLGLDVVWLESDWRRGIDANRIEEALRKDSGAKIKAVLATHTETSTGVTSQLQAVRAAIDAADHSALYMVDAVSSLACSELDMDGWGIDVVISASQKGLMLPPGLCFNAVNEKALQSARESGGRQSYWDWQAMLENNRRGYFPYTPATNLLYGLDVALDMLLEEGLNNVISRHGKLAGAARAAVAAWGLENLCREDSECSNSTTAVMMPDGQDADALRGLILERFNMSLGTGLGKLKGTVFRIGHLGDFNEPMLIGTLGGIEMGLGLAGISHRPGGVSAALKFLQGR